MKLLRPTTQAVHERSSSGESVGALGLVVLAVFSTDSVLTQGGTASYILRVRFTFPTSCIFCIVSGTLHRRGCS